MIGVSFTQETVDQLFRERYEHPDSLIQKRMEILYQEPEGLKHLQIADLSRRTL